ncbi:hypothetical protein BJ508DRAFT_344563 [Ascobolus immersus RN42]|uniref:Uncharacterized protein n=1 Tax=Ascobolus immersus RN42 TaxID=1160509 RepID=A0A3N4IE03_ASCIM|nr:hypothetical protein BJ508DRAFT_344563 [Ascobolus immersus RN42]
MFTPDARAPVVNYLVSFDTLELFIKGNPSFDCQKDIKELIADGTLMYIYTSSAYVVATQIYHFVETGNEARPSRYYMLQVLAVGFQDLDSECDLIDHLLSPDWGISTFPSEISKLSPKQRSAHFELYQQLWYSVPESHPKWHWKAQQSERINVPPAPELLEVAILDHTGWSLDTPTKKQRSEAGRTPVVDDSSPTAMTDLKLAARCLLSLGFI